MIDCAQLQKEAEILGLTLTEEHQKKLDIYAALLMEWNEKMNLTAIKQPESIVTKHFIDSLSMLCTVTPVTGARLIDVGTGAGFPSVPIKVLRPDICLTLLDGLNKRITFLKALGEALGQENQCIHARAEEAGRKAEYREQYDIATARAVAHLRELTEYCLPFVKVGGIFAAMKSGTIDVELEESKSAIVKLGGKLEDIKRFALEDGSARTIVVIKKISQTSTKFPRPYAKIAKFPML